MYQTELEKLGSGVSWIQTNSIKIRDIKIHFEKKSFKQKITANLAFLLVESD